MSDTIQKIGKRIKEFFDVKTQVYNEHHPEETIDNIDKIYIYCVSPNNFVHTIKSILYLLEPFNPKSLPADDPAELDFGEIIYYNDPNGKERAIHIKLPIPFASGSDSKAFEQWREKQRPSKEDIAKQAKAVENQKRINDLSDDFSIMQNRYRD